jgi:hypothetical protein
MRGYVTNERTEVFVMKKIVLSLFVVGLLSYPLSAMVNGLGVKLDNAQDTAARNLSGIAISKGAEKLLGTDEEETKEVASAVTDLLFGEKKKRTFWQKICDLFKRN